MSVQTSSQFVLYTPAELLQKMADLNAARHPKVTFPLPRYPKESGWQHGKPHDQRQFGGARDGGVRRHAGVDLEAPIGTPVLAMADGVLLRVAAFYESTWEITLLHPGVGIIRYGEVDYHSIDVTSVGSFVVQGQPIAKVGQRVTRGVVNPRAMLHLEWYTDVHRKSLLGTGQKNALSQGTKGTLAHPTFMRRDDMKDPTDLLQSAPLFQAQPSIWPDRWPEAWPDVLTFSNEILSASAGSRADENTVRAQLRGAPLFRARA